MEEKFYQFRIWYNGVYEDCRTSVEERRSVAEQFAEHFEKTNRRAIIFICDTYMDIRVNDEKMSLQV